MSAFSFEYPWLLLLILLWAVLLFYAALRREPVLQISSALLFPVLRRTEFSWRKWSVFVLYALSGLCLIAALAGPRFGHSLIKQQTEGVDLLLAIDLSTSMDAYDIPKRFLNQADDAPIRRAYAAGEIPQRIQACKQAVLDFIKKRPDDRLGLIVFASHAYSICPPTADHAWLKQQIQRLETGSIEDGTGIAAPIAQAILRLKETDAKRKILILFTDGDNTFDHPLTPLQAAQSAKEHDVVIYPVGIGSPHAFVAQQVWGHEQLAPYAYRFDEKLMKEIAETTGGHYFHAGDEAEMAKVLDQINQLEKVRRETVQTVLYDHYAADMALWALLLLCGAFLLEHTIALRYP